MMFLVFSMPLFVLAQDASQWHLPEGAKARLGKGCIVDVEYSPDGTVLLWDIELSKP